MKNILLLVLIVAISSCSNNPKNKDIDIDIEDEVVFVVSNTYSDRYEPWLSLRKEDNSCSSEISKLKDGTMVRIIDDNKGNNYVEVEVISQRGFVSRSYLESSKNRHINPEKELINYSKEILSFFDKGDLSNIRKYIFQNSFKFFYWDIKACDLSSSKCNSLTVLWDDGNIEQEIYGRNLIYQAKKYSTSRISYEGKDMFPAAGFGGGSVMPPSGETHIVIIPKDSSDESDKLWFEYAETETGFSLIELGIWQWSP